MATTYTADASVFINAFNPYEEGYADSHRLLAKMQERGIPVIVPTLVLPEVAAAIARGRDDTELGQRFAAALSRLPHLYLVPLDNTTALQASEIAAAYRLRGADAVYAAVALRFDTVLVTRDQEQRERVASLVPVRTPAEVLEQDGGPGRARR